ncbi:HdeD family acid-resistance protein [Nostoc sp. TCL26-01]|uniref:HdeD family acid-resistance protein n=1 Tax=Nostoc sp. TCL26-01 TaxID=2576904 RepID=UPI0015BB526C|nr:HdeD family acid-resistance protein [Nostoc sp. TCL26-01]QLE56273.1 HdeD family acid-resistance protein [Nostoc sp. TCL26-01]
MRNNLYSTRISNRLAKNWWTLTLRGAIAIIFGLVALAWPTLTLTALVYLFATFWLAGGVLLAIAALREHLYDTHNWLLLLEGVVGIAVGMLAFIWPGVTAFVLLYLIAAWAIVTGVLEMITALQLRQAMENEWLPAVTGLVSLIFGVMLIIWPVAEALAILWLIAAYAILFGTLLLILGFKLRSWHNQHQIS